MRPAANVYYLLTWTTTPTWRDRAAVAAKAALATVCIAAVVSAIGWCLYLPGDIDADAFVGVLRLALSIAAAGVGFAALSIPMTWLWDRLRSRRGRS